MSDSSLILKLLEDRHYKANYTPRKGAYIFKIANKNIGSIGNFVIFSGLPKAGKTKFLLAALATSFIKDSIFKMKITLPKKNSIIGLFDTENVQEDFYDNLNQVRIYTGLDSLPGNFNAFATRKDSYKDVRLMIETYIKQFKPTVLIIDHMLDLVKNFNDETEASEVVTWLKNITEEYNVLIIGVIHLGKKDGHTLGHYGSMLDRAAQSIIEIVKDKENALFLMKAKMLRKAEDFDDIAIMWNGSEYVEVLAPAPKKKR